MSVGILLIGPFAPAGAQPSPNPFGIAPDSLQVTPSSTQAGAHADLSLSIEFAHDESGRTFNDLRAAAFDLPAGFVGNAEAVPACTQAEFLAGDLVPECPPASQVGSIEADGHFGPAAVTATMPLYRLAPGRPGAPPELGFRFFSVVQRVTLRVRPQDGGLTLSVDEVAARLEPSRVDIEIWGEPAAAIHDPDRGRACVGLGSEPGCEGGGEEAGVLPRPFLANPTRCGPARVEVRASSWEEPQSWSSETAEAGPIQGCEKVPFEPKLEARTDSAVADSPSGLAVSLEIPGDWSDSAHLTSSALRDAKVLLPAGFSLNPAVLAGLSACTSKQLARELSAATAGEGCPGASRVGSVHISTPILAEPATGSIFLAEPFDNPTGARFAVYAVAGEPATGVRLELAVKLEPESGSGRLAIAVEDVPQIPLARLGLSFDAGPTAPLVTPASCGRFETTVELAPYSAPAEPRSLSDQLAIGAWPGGNSCPAGAPPFHPELTTSSGRRRAGGYSSFGARLSRRDGEARIDSLSLRLPPGLSARLVGVTVCPEAALPAACSPRSLLGRTVVEVGAGPSPARLPGHAYLAGPYAGSPLSVVLVTPALLGPFDLGTLVVREPLRWDPTTGALIVGSSRVRLPAAIDGLPLHLRGVELTLDRPQLVRNPTSCRPLATAARLTGLGAAGSAQTAQVTSPFRAVGCHGLRFAPTLRLRMLGTTARNGHPGLRATLVSHPDEANLAGASLSLPRDMLFDLGRLGGICGDRAAEAGACPPGSIIGRARATSPLLSERLAGPVFLRRNPSGRLPDLVAELGNRTVDLRFMGRLRIGPSGVRVAIEAAPDLPVSKLAFVIAGGRRGLLAFSRGFCDGWRRIGVSLVGQNGKRKNLRPRLAPRCPPHSDADVGRRTP